MPRGLKSYGPAVVVTIASIVLAARLFLLIWQYGVNIFFWDEWDLKDVTLFEKHSLWRMFVSQHGWHRLGLGAWLEALIDPLFRWNSRSEAYILWVILVATALCALWLKIRLVGNLSAFDVVIPAIVFTPAQWEVLYGTPIFSQGPLPFLLIVVCCLAWTCERNAVRYPLILAINFVTIYTGFGFFLGALTPVLLLLDHFSRVPAERLRKGYLVASVVVALASLGSLFVGYKPTAGIFCFSLQERSPHFYIVFMALIWAHFFALDWTGFLPRIVGKSLLIILLVALGYGVAPRLRRQTGSLPHGEQKRWLIPATLITVSLLSCMTIAYFRVCGGMASALATRYAVYAQIGALGLYFQLINMRRSWRKTLAMLALTVPLLFASFHVDRAGMEYFRDLKQRWKTCYFETGDITRCDQVAGFPMHPRRERTHLDQKLQFLKEKHLNLYSDSK